jgi:hypothetical protein
MQHSRASEPHADPRPPVNHRLKIQFGAPDEEWYAARNILSLQ